MTQGRVKVVLPIFLLPLSLSSAVVGGERKIKRKRKEKDHEERERL